MIANSNIRNAIPSVFLDFVKRLIEVSSHDIGIADSSSITYPTPNANNRVFDNRAAEDAAFGDDTLMQVTFVHL